MDKREKGYFYEERAISEIKERGYTVVEQNFYGKRGEIDIIAKKGNLVVFFEVKYRSSFAFGSGAYSINRDKLKKMYLTGREYIFLKKLDKMEFRFDAIVFMGEKLEWIENILWGDDIGF